jgi:tetratricopeptide (TPR) repeat protein
MALMDKSRSLAGSAPRDAVDVARQAVVAADVTGDGSMRIDTVLNLITRLSSGVDRSEKTRLIDEWKLRVYSEGNADQKCIMDNLLAIAHLERSEAAEAMQILRKSLDRFPEIKNARVKTSIKVNLANAYSALGISDRAIQWFGEALSEAQKAGDKQIIASVHNNIGILHRKLHNNLPAVDHFMQVVALATEIGDTGLLGQAYNNLCTAYFYLEDYDKAMSYAHQSHTLAIQRENQFGIQAALTNFGAIHKKKMEYGPALEYYEQALAMASGLENKHQIANLLKNVGDIYLVKKQYHQVLSLYGKARGIAEEIGAIDLLNDIYLGFIRLHEERGDYEQEVKFLKLEMEIQESLFTGRQREVVDQYRLRYEAEQKEREAEMLRERNNALEDEIAERRRVEAELTAALSQIKVLTGLLPVCAHCKKIRDEEGNWHQIEYYISKRTDARFSHGICPDCRETHYGM